MIPSTVASIRTRRRFCVPYCTGKCSSLFHCSILTKHYLKFRPLNQVLRLIINAGLLSRPSWQLQHGDAPIEKKMELHNMEKLETHPFSSGSRGFLLTRVVVRKYTERQVAVFKGRIQIIGSPECNSVLSQDRPTASLWLPPTRRLERGTFQKEIPRLAGGDVGQRLWERGQDVSCAVFL